MGRADPNDFIFHVKVFVLFTRHAAEVRSLPRELQDDLPHQLRGKGRVYVKEMPAGVQEETWRRFGEALLPLKDAGKLGKLLFQFPPGSFLPRRPWSVYCDIKRRVPSTDSPWSFETTPGSTRTTETA